MLNILHTNYFWWMKNFPRNLIQVGRNFFPALYQCFFSASLGYFSSYDSRQGKTKIKLSCFRQNKKDSFSTPLSKIIWEASSADSICSVWCFRNYLLGIFFALRCFRETRMPLCGPKLSLCGVILSAWGIVQLVRFSLSSVIDSARLLLVTCIFHFFLSEAIPSFIFRGNAISRIQIILYFL